MYVKERVVRKSILVLITLAFLPSFAGAQRLIDWDKVQVKTQKLDEYVYLLQFIGPEELQRSEEHTSELQSRGHLVCRLLLEKKKEIYFELWITTNSHYNKLS